MATLVQLSNDIDTERCQLEIADYTRTLRLCRSGLWIGWICRQSQRVVLSYEHDPEPLYVGWAINATTVLDPGHGTFTPPWGQPCPDAADVTYQTGVDWYSHRIGLSVTPGTPERNVHVQVLYRGPADAGSPPTAGPDRYVQLAGVRTSWPANLLGEERRCWQRLLELLRRYVELPPWGPPDPWERLHELVRDPDDMLVLAAVAGLDELDPKADGQLIEEYSRRAAAVISRLTLLDGAVDEQAR